jgi:hypothetical protein
MLETVKSTTPFYLILLPIFSIIIRSDPVLEAPMLGGVWGRIFPGKPYPAIIAERLLEPRTSWHQWDDFTTTPALSSLFSIIM